ncbi:MAG: ThiF family adenylyltransferase [Bacteroidetes bacterium]|nr:ThiF family adenylyltransferase [Bacteroidota bacterium]
MEFHNVSEINELVSKIPFVKIIDEFKNEVFTKGKILVHNIEGLNENLEFEVIILPQYPLKSHDSEAIKFINKDLIPYKHVMGDGAICIHTLHSPNLKQKLNADFESLKNWIIKYYINKENDTHYEHIIIDEQPFNDIYYSYQFTDVKDSFTKGDFGQVELIHLNNGIYKKKRISNYLIKSFQSYNPRKKRECNWSDYYLKLNTTNSGLFVFLKDVPALHNRFAFTNWLELEKYLPNEFLKFLNDCQKNNTKHNNTFLPIFFGYNTIDSEIHWIATLIKLNELPTIGIPAKDSNGIKIKGKWNSKLIDKKIEWAITRNSSYKYLFGRGTFCNEITNAKILIIGVGAIGSLVAKTLVKCGAKDISLIDFDVKEPENVCRSEYEFQNGLYDKTFELMDILRKNSPFVEVKFHNNNEYFESYIKVLHKDKSERKSYEQSLNQFDIIFNCSADNDLMYVLDQLKLNTDLINLSITNHAYDLVCAIYPNIYKFVQNQFINVLDNDVDDLYKPTGCWSPTFKASYNDINLLVQFALKEINLIYKENRNKANFTLSFESENNLNIKMTKY